MKKLISKIKLAFKFFKWYKCYVKNGMRPSIAFVGMHRDFVQFQIDNPYLHFVFIEDTYDAVGRQFDFYIMSYHGRNFINNKMEEQLWIRSNLINKNPLPYRYRHEKS